MERKVLKGTQMVLAFDDEFHPKYDIKHKKYCQNMLAFLYIVLNYILNTNFWEEKKKSK